MLLLGKPKALRVPKFLLFLFICENNKLSVKNTIEIIENNIIEIERSIERFWKKLKFFLIKFLI